jgi:murein DD-endopeptidase MepM/ murein hydrolase activator NlpD
VSVSAVVLGASPALPPSVSWVSDGTVTPSLIPPGVETLREAPFGIGDGSFVGFSNPSSTVIPERSGLKRYKVQKGDTLSRIAAQFGISLDTLRSANPDIRPPLRVGSTLLILPVSGLLYEIAPGDSSEAVAARYEVSVEAVRQYNPDFQKMFADGHGTLILPYGKEPRATPASPNELPDLKGYFLLPAAGWNWGTLHAVNAVDISGTCDTKVVASADGLVMEASAANVWNGGYGNSVLIEHPNGTRTRYAHLGEVSVSVGTYVVRGETIGTMGDLGASHGPKGCSLHFEVQGAKNPFARQ